MKQKHVVSYLVSTALYVDWRDSLAVVCFFLGSHVSPLVG